MKKTHQLTALTHLLIFFVDEIELICAHFPWNNLYLLLIEKYFLGPILFLKLIPFFMSITNLRFSEFCGKWHLKQMIAKVIYLTIPLLPPLHFSIIFLVHISFKKKESSKFKCTSGSFFRMSGVIPVNRNKEFLLSLSFSILASNLA